MRDYNLGVSLAMGAAAGLAGTIALQLIRTATQKHASGTTPPIKEEPGAFMVRKTEQALPVQVTEKIPRKVEYVAAKSLGMGYGMTFGSLYAASRPGGGGNSLIEGAALGVATWAAGYLGWLPAVKLMPPVSKQNARQVWTPIIQHALYGISTVATYNWISKRA